MKYAIKAGKINMHRVLIIEVALVRFYSRPQVYRDTYVTEGRLIFRGNEPQRSYSVNLPRLYEERSGAEEEFVRMARSDASIVKEFG